MKTFPWREFLQRHPIFATIGDEKRIDALLENEVSWERMFAKDEIIVRQGDWANSIFVIGSGSAEAVLELGGGASISLSVLRRGEVFGEMALLERRARSATVRAKEPCTVLEFRATEFEQLMADYPDIEFRLLLKMSERLRSANEQVLGLQANLDDKLKIFNLKLDTEQRLVDSSLKAAQTMFDQTKLRADEVITSAERSRARLQQGATVIGAFATVVLGVLGFIGAKQIWDISQVKTETASYAKDTKDSSERAKTASEAAEKLVEKIQDSRSQIQEAIELSQTAKRELVPLQQEMVVARDGLHEAKTSVQEVLRGRLFEEIDRGAAKEANRSYTTLKSLGGLGHAEVEALLSEIDEKVVVSAFPPKGGSATQQPDVFAFLLRQVANDAPAPREKVKAYYLLLTYAIATTQKALPTADLTRLGPRKEVSDELRDFLRSHPEAKLRETDISEELRKRIGQQAGEPAGELQLLKKLAVGS